jgi:UDP-N-acetylglucosamine--N-acetylmuramyl-(pentapeptide) pyrophosphoryl-undecaprenol N-acetylglucosamine transferase
VCLVAGGTGGHIYPAVAVARALVALHPELRAGLVVDARPASADAVRRAGYEPMVLPMRHGLQRSLAPLAVVRSARALVDFVWSFVRSVAWLRTTRPRVVVGFGAYVTVPVTCAARALRIPVVVHEQNAFPGLANRLAVRLGARAAVSAPSTRLRGAVVTGNPIRPEIATVRRDPVVPPLVAIVGASLGSTVLNDAGLGLFERWRERADVSLRLVTGPERFAVCSERLARSRRANDVVGFELVPYEHNMAGLYADATVMVTRGGGSVWELAAAGMPAIIVPWSGATEDHQTANARACEVAGGAIHLPEPDCTASRLAAELDRLLAAPERLEAMSVAMRALARPSAAAAVAELVYEALAA